MARRGKPSKRSDKLHSFVATPWGLLNSQAYKDLPPSAAKALLYFQGKPKRPFNDSNYYEVHFTFSYSEAETFGFSKSTFSRVIRNLIAYGFIDPVKKGGLRGDGKACSRFKLSDRWSKYGTKSFEEILWKTFIQQKL